MKRKIRTGERTIQSPPHRVIGIMLTAPARSMDAMRATTVDVIPSRLRSIDFSYISEFRCGLSVGT